MSLPNFLLAAFFFCQCWPIVFVILTSQTRSLINFNNSNVAKNLMSFYTGLLSGLSNCTATRITRHSHKHVIHFCCRRPQDWREYLF
jgi:hypothetical protein